MRLKTLHISRVAASKPLRTTANVMGSSGVGESVGKESSLSMLLCRSVMATDPDVDERRREDDPTSEDLGVCCFDLEEDETVIDQT